MAISPPGARAGTAHLRLSEPGSAESLADALAALAGFQGYSGELEPPDGFGVERTREAVDELARRLLPPVQRWSGNRDRLGETRLPLLWFDRVEVTPTFPLFADVVAHTTGGARLTVLGLFKDQARQLADHLRTG